VSVVESELVHEVRDMLANVPRAPEQPPVGGASEDDIADLVSRLGRSLPDDLLAWLRICRGEAIGPGGVFGARPDGPALDIQARLALYPSWDDHGWLPVAGDGCGNVYVLIERGRAAGAVGFIDVLADPIAIGYLVASDLWHFLRFLFARELGERGWPFQADAVLSIDPHLSRVPASLLPWTRR
jgi:hypothetical protein